MSFFVYILHCADSTYYTGCTNNLERRCREHNISDKGARYTKARRPVKVIYTEEFETLLEARRREYKIKALKRSQKEELIKSLSALGV